MSTNANPQNAPRKPVSTKSRASAASQSNGAHAETCRTADSASRPVLGWESEAIGSLLVDRCSPSRASSVGALGGIFARQRRPRREQDQSGAASCARPRRIRQTATRLSVTLPA